MDFQKFLDSMNDRDLLHQYRRLQTAYDNAETEGLNDAHLMHVAARGRQMEAEMHNRGMIWEPQTV